ncbi:hypothetical protein NVP1038O_24 [Vibrio phage 1.038.O._10N.286.51.C2]|nr:hypothetical protein NVP1038O_24 [Vibrio phage 1.038.O._10N.286.51.C2]
MSNLKTSDIWPDGYKLTFDYCPSNTSSHETFGFIFGSSEPCIFICDVVNNHDRMVEEIAELRSFARKVSELDIETFHFETQGGDEDFFEYVCADIVGDAVELLEKLNKND